MTELVAGSAAVPPEGPRPVLTIGNFDGVHLGHQALLARVVSLARNRGTTTCLYTFEPAPRAVLAPHQVMPRILGWPDRVALMGALGLERVVIERFTRSFAQHPPEWFVTEILGRRLRPQALVVGYDFRFGRARAGTSALVRELLPDVLVIELEPVSEEGVVVSSSAIRRAVSEGEVAQAARMLGRPHFLRGTVVPGDQRGRTIGFPTANLETDAELVPRAGVYAVRASVDGGPDLPAVANLGTRPTFDGLGFLIEVHLLEGGQDLYGRELRLSFVERLRDERRFEGKDALIAQIRDDCERARAVLAR